MPPHLLSLSIQERRVPRKPSGWWARRKSRQSVATVTLRGLVISAFGRVSSRMPFLKTALILSGLTGIPIVKVR